MSIQKLNTVISPKLQELFVIDHLGGAMPVYDIALAKDTVSYISSNHKIIDTNPIQKRIRIDLLPDFKENDLLNLIERACLNSYSDKYIDAIPSTVLYHPTSCPFKLRKINDIGSKYCQYISYKSYLPLPCIPKKYAYIFPEQEFTGAIAVDSKNNIGAFIVSENITKVKI